LAIADTPYGRESLVATGPQPGEVWLASRWFAALAVPVGDALHVGSAQFPVAAALLRAPDSSGSFFDAGARVMMHIADVPKTQAVQVGSRVTYRWLLAGEAETLAEFQRWLKGRMSEHFRWITPAQSGEGISNA